MRIGEVADRIAVNPKTIRYYESVGLIPEPPRTESGYRDYREEDFERIRFIKTARRLDLSLDEIREILAFTDTQRTPCGHVQQIVRRKTQELDKRIAEMVRLRAELLEMEESIPPEAAGRSQGLCPLIEHHTPPISS